MRGWVEALRENDSAVIWSRLFNVIARHSAVNQFYSRNIAFNRRGDIHKDLTQDLFLILHMKNRWQWYLENEYSDNDIERELYRIEVPNLISGLQRQNYPESYRIARRISELLQTDSAFRLFESDSENSSSRACQKMALKIYGLSRWGSRKAMRPASTFVDAMKNVAFRQRDTRRTGRGCGSQVIISNQELKQLLVDIFNSIDSPVDIRSMRSLALSKLAVEDCRLVSIDETISGTAVEPAITAELVDERPTPLEMLLKKETSAMVDDVAADLIQQMKVAVNRRPGRFRKLITIAWHCYFDLDSPSQSEIAAWMGISESLVSHYRKIFDSVIQKLDIPFDELVLLNASLDRKLSALILEVDSEIADQQSVTSVAAAQFQPAVTRAASVSAGG